MGPANATATRSRGWLVWLLGALMAAAMVLLAAPMASHAAPGDDQEKTPFYFAGGITYKDKPIPDVVVAVEGGGYKASTKTDAEG